MRTGLATSIGHIHDVAAERLGCGDLEVAAALNEIEAHRVAPALYGRYFDAVLALHSGRDDEAGDLLREMVALAARVPVMRVVPFTERALGADLARFARLLDLANDPPSLLASPPQRAWPAFADAVATALDLIDGAAPELGVELRALIVEIVGAAAPRPSTRDFGGASSSMLWGAVVLNIARHQTALDAVGGLVHEAAHQLLFGLATDDPLVENPLAERFDSPLRHDGRPMIGVFHATFVCARVHYAYDRLLQADPAGVSAADSALMTSRLAAERRGFHAGYDTVRRHGRLTETGDRILGAAHAYMERAA